MPTMALRAHYDGKHIVLDEGYDLARDTPLLVIPISNSEPGGTSKKSTYIRCHARQSRSFRRLF